MAYFLRFGFAEITNAYRGVGMRNSKLVLSVFLAGVVILSAAAIVIEKSAKAAGDIASKGAAMPVEPVNAIIATVIVIIAGIAVYIKRNRAN